MAYRAEIQIGVKGAGELKQLQERIKDLAFRANALDEITKNLFSNQTVQSVRNYSKALSEARSALDAVEVATEDESAAVKEYVTALGQANAAAERQNKLIEEEITLRNKAKKSIETQQRRAEFLAGPGRTLPAEKAAQRAIKQGEESQERFRARQDFAQKMFDIEKGFNKKLNEDEISNLLKRYQLEESLHERAFNRLLQAGEKEGREFDIKLKKQTDSRLEATKAVKSAETRRVAAIYRLEQRNLNKLERDRIASERRAAKRREDAISNAIIGGAFPLLFGQGAGAAVGGGLGGFGGGLLGGQFGFGLSLVGTAAGTSFDVFAQKATDLSVALDTAADSTQALEALVGRLDKATAKRISNLAASGQAARAASLAFETLAEKIGVDNAAAVVQAGRDFDRLGKLWQNFTTTIGAGIASLIQEAFSLNLDRDPLTGRPRQEGPLKTEAAERLEAQAAGELSIAKLQRVEAEALLAKDIERLAITQQIRAEKQADLETTAIANDLKDDLISKELAFTKLQKVEEDLNRELLRIDLQRRDAVESRAKEQDRAAKAAAREQEIAARAAAREMQRQLREQEQAKRQLAAAIISEIQVLKNRFAFSVKLAEFEGGAEAALNRRLQQLVQERDGQLEILNIQSEQKIANAKSLEEREALIRAYNMQYDLIADQYNLEYKITLEKQKQLQAVKSVQALSAAAGFDVLARAGLTQPFADRGLYGAPEGLMDFSTGAELSAIVKQEVALARVLEKYQEIGQAAQLTSELVTTGFADMVSGTRSAEEVFANFLNSLADMLIKTAQQMIAQYIAIGIARLFATGGSFDPSSLDLSGSQYAAGSLGPLPFGGTGFPGRANGGPVSGGTPYIVGERGPELFIPFQRGQVVSNEDTQQLMGQAQTVSLPFTRTSEKVLMERQERERLAAMQDPGAIDVRYESTVINNTEYVTAEQHRKGLAQAAERGRALTLQALQNSPKTRRKVGI